MDLRIYEVGISYYRRAYKEGKKLAGKTALKQYIAFSIITDSDERLRILSVRIRQTWGPYPPLRAEQD
jgi:hypothetical protein